MQKLRKSKQLNIQLACSALAAQLSNFPEKEAKIKTNTTGSQFWRLELRKDSVDEIYSLSGTEIGTWNDFIPFLWFGIRFLPKIWTMTTVATKWQVKQQKISIFFKNNRDSFRYDANVEIWLKSVWSRTYSTSCPDKSIFLTFGYLRRNPPPQKVQWTVRTGGGGEGKISWITNWHQLLLNGPHLLFAEFSSVLWPSNVKSRLNYGLL